MLDCNFLERIGTVTHSFAIDCPTTPEVQVVPLDQEMISGAGGRARQRHRAPRPCPAVRLARPVCATNAPSEALRFARTWRPGSKAIRRGGARHSRPGVTKHPARRSRCRPHRLRLARTCVDSSPETEWRARVVSRVVETRRRETGLTRRRLDRRRDPGRADAARDDAAPRRARANAGTSQCMKEQGYASAGSRLAGGSSPRRKSSR